ncbi:MAG: aspartate carbamoyltransferase catalytic subunit [Alphaproteobacteria bacterium]
MKNRNHLLQIQGMNKPQLDKLLERGFFFAEKNRKKEPLEQSLKNHTVVNLFFENSTRTRTSCEQAAKRLGAEVINMSVATSSVAKGETLLDTTATLNAMHPDILVVRHGSSGAPAQLAQKVNCAVINAGDGWHEHPTQALLDALTMKRHKKSLDALTVTICGDITHSRVARSNIHLLNNYNCNIRLCGPKTMVPKAMEDLGAKVYHHMEEALEDADVVMMLRIQKERINSNLFPSSREFFHFYGLDYKKLRYAKPDAIVMHPGPMNRGVEISSKLADDPERSVITEQVEMGVAMRMAALEYNIGYEG